jgi:hypothetical protein
MFQLKPISRESIPRVLEKAEHYRLLNEPREAESICRDVLEVEADNQQALVLLVLSLSDQLNDQMSHAYNEAREVLPRLRDPYNRLYYEGILCERRAKALLKRGGPGCSHAAYAGLQHAMQLFERASAHRPAGNDDAVLRFNTCVRLLQRHPELVPAPAISEEMLE